jgi:hypothetical protein
MVITAAVLIAVAAVLGIAMAVMRVRGTERPPTGLALAHGAIAALGVVLYLIVVVGADPTPTLGVVAIVLFVLAALGGLVLFGAFHLQGKALSIPLVVVHGAVAAVAYVLLLVAILRPNGY